MRSPVFLAGLACLLGCAGPEPKRFLASDFAARAPSKAALLPFDNESVDLTAPDLLRRFAREGLVERGYELAPLDDVDKVLVSSFGVTDGGQLRSIEPAQLGRALGVGALFYGVIEDFAFINVGFAVRRVVRLRLRLVDAAGTLLWEDAGQGLSEWLTLSKKQAKRAFWEGVADRGIENAIRKPLTAESHEAVKRTFMSLPRGSGR